MSATARLPYERPTLRLIKSEVMTPAQRAFVNEVTRNRMDKRDVVGAAAKYKEAGFRIVPLEPKTKHIEVPSWPRLDFSPSDFHPDSNIGFQMFGGLVDTDVDCPLAVKCADAFLPKTQRISGRKSKPQSHWWYQLPEAIFEQFTDFDKKYDSHVMLVEIRAEKGGKKADKGRQTMVPPSIHPDDELLFWHSEGEANRVEYAGYRQAVVYLATTALIARHWPAVGTRGFLRLALAGVLLKTLRIDVEEAVKILQWACRLGGCDAKGIDHAERAVRDTADKLKDPNEAVTGEPRVKELLAEDNEGAKLLARLREWHQIADTDYELTIISARDVKDEKLETLFGGRLVRGSFGIVCGPGDVGKGMWLVDTIARLSTGEPFPGEEKWRDPGIVLVCVVEDSASRVKARLRAAGADLDNIHFVSGPSVTRGGLVMMDSIMLDNDAGKLVRAAKQYKAVGLFLETTVEHLGDREGKKRWSTNNDADVRRSLAPFRAVCQEANLYGVGVMHPRKSTDGSIAESISGSAAFRNVGRWVHNIYMDPLDTDKSPWRLFCSSKANHLKERPDTLRFRIDPWEQDPDEGRVVWGIAGRSLVDARCVEAVWGQIQERQKASRPRKDIAVRDAEEFLKRVLTGGMVHPTQLEKMAKEELIALSALKRAKENLHVESVKSGFPAQVVGWRLAEDDLS